MQISPAIATPLLGLCLGQTEPFGPKGELSAIRKRPATGRVRIATLGLVGDQQADHRHHGGPDKALHHYPHEHYAVWRAELPQRADAFALGGFGENLSTAGLTEHEACLGDIYRLGGAVIQIAQGRKPCWKLNARFGVDDMVARVHSSGRTGWYYRVLEEGEAGPEDGLTLLDRPCPDWTVHRLYRTLYVAEAFDPEALDFLAATEVLAAGWREQAARRVAGEGR